MRCLLGSLMLHDRRFAQPRAEIRKKVHKVHVSSLHLTHTITSCTARPQDLLHVKARLVDVLGQSQITQITTIRLPYLNYFCIIFAFFACHHCVSLRISLFLCICSSALSAESTAYWVYCLRLSMSLLFTSWLYWDQVVLQVSVHSVDLQCHSSISQNSKETMRIGLFGLFHDISPNFTYSFRMFEVDSNIWSSTGPLPWTHLGLQNMFHTVSHLASLGIF